MLSKKGDVTIQNIQYSKLYSYDELFYKKIMQDHWKDVGYLCLYSIMLDTVRQYNTPCVIEIACELFDLSAHSIWAWVFSSFFPLNLFFYTCFVWITSYL